MDKQKRIEDILITNLQKDFLGMVEEMDNYYKELTEELTNSLN